MGRVSIRIVRTYIEFVLSRLLGTGVDTLVLWICSAFIFNDTYFGRNVVSPIISFEFAVMSNYLCSYFWIWRARIETRGMRTFWSRFVIFNLSSVAGFLVKILFLQVFVITFKWNVVVCNLAALLISGILNFLLADSMVFRKRKSKVDKAAAGVFTIPDEPVDLQDPFFTAIDPKRQDRSTGSNEA